MDFFSRVETLFFEEMYFVLNGPMVTTFSCIFVFSTVKLMVIENCQWLDSNPGPLVLQVTPNCAIATDPLYSSF